MDLAASRKQWSAFRVVILVSLGLGPLHSGCADPVEPTPPGPTSVVGRVVDEHESNLGIADVLVRAIGKSVSTNTDSTGYFALPISAYDGEWVQLGFSKAGFDEVTRALQVKTGIGNGLNPPVSFRRTGGGPNGTSGPASSIVLQSASATSIGVRHTGQNETARLVFEVHDAEGRPVGYSHRVTVQFTLLQAAGGGAFLDRDTVSTDTSGVVAVTVSSGTLAQLVQIRAQVMGTPIFSEISTIAIHGGLPDANHLSFACESVNVPGLLEFGIVNRVTAFVGDRYGNPVPEGNVVYFSTTGGIIQASAATDAHGRASVDMLTAAPLPNPVPAFSESASVARISVQTFGENGVRLVRSALAVAFTGHAEVSLVPASTFHVGQDSSQTFVVTVWDREHHNPLTAGTTITFTATIGTVSGQTSLTLPDTWDPQYTSFQFRLDNFGSAPAIVGPDNTRAVLRPTEKSAGDTGALAALPAGGGELSALRFGNVTVAVNSRNGNAVAAVRGSITVP